jgi:hypothetical protein
VLWDCVGISQAPNLGAEALEFVKGRQSLYF